MYGERNKKTVEYQFQISVVAKNVANGTKKLLYTNAKTSVPSPDTIRILTMFSNYRPLNRVVNSHILTCSIPAIPNARYVPSLLCHERFNEASLPVFQLILIKKNVSLYSGDKNTLYLIFEIRPYYDVSAIMFISFLLIFSCSLQGYPHSWIGFLWI